MLKGDVFKGVVENSESSVCAVLINIGANRFVRNSDIKSYFDLLKLKRVKTIDTRIIPLSHYNEENSNEYIRYGMVEPYFDSIDTLKPISLKKAKQLR